MAARFLYMETFEFQPMFKLWMFTNYLPKNMGGDGIWRRVKLIPFSVHIPDEMKDDRLGEEAPARGERHSELGDRRATPNSVPKGIEHSRGDQASHGWLPDVRGCAGPVHRGLLFCWSSSQRARARPLPSLPELGNQLRGEHPG